MSAAVEAAAGRTATVAAEDRDRAINACVNAYRGETVIVLICVDLLCCRGRQENYQRWMGASCPH